MLLTAESLVSDGDFELSDEYREQSWTDFYDGALVAEYSWTGGIYGDGGGAAGIAAVDVFANGSSSVYYDDLSLRPTRAP